MKNQTRGILLVVLSAFCYGLTPTFTKQIYAFNISVISTITLRFLIAFFALGIFLLLKDKRLLYFERSKIRTYLILGTSYLSVLGFTLAALKYSPIAIVILILYTYPILIFLYKIFFQNEARDGKTVVLLFGSLLGMFLLMGTSFQNALSAGTMYAFLASISFAVYVILSGKNSSNQSPFTLGFYTYFTATIVISIYYISTIGFSVTLISASILPFLLLGIGTTIFPSLLFLKALNYLKTTKAAALAMLEPLFAILFAFILNGEKLTMIQIFGGTILFICSFIISSKK
jgi:drug/metabolite transporter (DMT)-like permease